MTDTATTPTPGTDRPAPHPATTATSAGAATPPTSGPRSPLLHPVDLGDLRLPNRVVMAPATRARAADPGLVPTELHAAYYGQRATAGLVVTEGTWVSEQAVGFVNVPGIYSQAQVAGWRRVTDVVHALGGRIVLQLWHTGAASHPDLLGGRLPIGPSAVNPHETSFTAAGPQQTVTPREMTAQDIATTVSDYRAAARNARRAGFDGVELNALGSFLIPQFLNPALNLRSDRYGGDRAGRRRLLLDVVDAITEPWDGRRVGVRLSPYWTADRFTADDAILADYEDLVGALNGRGLAYLHLRGPGPTGIDGSPFAAAGRPLVPLDFGAFARYGRLFDGPVIANHGFDEHTGNAVIAAGAADAVSYAAHFIANPDLVARFALGRALATGDQATYYTGGAHGYVDYPVSDWHPDPAEAA